MGQPLPSSAETTTVATPLTTPKLNALSWRPDRQIFGFSQALAAQLSGGSRTLVVWRVEIGEDSYEIYLLEETALK